MLGFSVNNYNVCLQEECPLMIYIWCVIDFGMFWLTFDTYIWLDVYLHVMCHLKEFVTYWVPPLNEYLDWSTFKYALGIGLLSYGRLSTDGANVCFELTRTPLFNCIPCVTGIILWHDENCCKQVCRQKINYQLSLGNGRYSLDNDRVKTTSMENNVRW